MSQCDISEDTTVVTYD